nr:hypothetical protein [uncultured Dongia sp.]
MAEVPAAAFGGDLACRNQAREALIFDGSDQILTVLHPGLGNFTQTSFLPEVRGALRETAYLVPCRLLQGGERG